MYINYKLQTRSEKPTLLFPLVFDKYQDGQSLAGQSSRRILLYLLKIFVCILSKEELVNTIIKETKAFLQRETSITDATNKRYNYYKIHSKQNKINFTIIYM